MGTRTTPAADINNAIAGLAGQGFEVRQRTRETASLARRKRFGYGTFLVLFLLGGWPGVLYIGWHLANPEDTVFLHLDSGRVVETRSYGFEGWFRLAIAALVTLLVVLLLAGMFIVSSSGGTSVR